MLLAVLVGCTGWRWGAPPASAMSFGAVEGATAQPGLSTDLQAALLRGARERSIPAGPPVQVILSRAEDRPEATAAGRAVAWTAMLTVAATRPDRADCRVEVAGRRSWGIPSADASGADAARAEAWHLLAEDVADRLVDALLATPECR